ncbi:MAG: MATE family efflux transporter, partial [Terriglobales bacterium]
DLAALAGYFFGRNLLKGVLSGQSSARSDLKDAWEIVRIGSPVALSELTWLMSGLLLLTLLGQLPDAASGQAAWTLTLKLEELVAFSPILSCCMATASIVGQTRGAGKFDQATRIAHRICIISASAIFLVGVGLSLTAPYLVPLLTNDARVATLACTYLCTTWIAFPFSAVGLIYGAALEGAGMTVTPTMVNICTLLAFRLPLAWLLAANPGFGAVGPWIARCVSQAIAALAMQIAFVRKTEFVSSGGGDSLSHALQRAGNKAALVIPAYRITEPGEQRMRP